MKKKMLYDTVVICFVVIYMDGCSRRKREHFLPTEDNVRTIGRTSYVEDTLWLVHSGIGMEFTFEGTYAKIHLKSGDDIDVMSKDTQARIAIYVNEQCVIDDIVDQEEEIYTVFQSDESQECVIKVIKLSESLYGSVGISEIGVRGTDNIKPTKEKELLIEFVGDSITCGYGVDDENREHHFSTTKENVTKTYAYKTAQMLDADMNVVAFSGYGVISGYSSDGSKKHEKTIPQYYEKLGYSSFSYMDCFPVEHDWFDGLWGRKPDIIVFNLGTNDSKYTATSADKIEEFIVGYVEFLNQIRKNNPDAYIICSLGIMKNDLNSSVEDAVERYKLKYNDTNVCFLLFDVQSKEDGFAADSHPTEKTHAKAAAKLAEKIKEKELFD